MVDSVLFDRYELLEPAGRGGSAEVWRARDRETGDIVALKRLHPVVLADEAGRQRLEREFRLLRDLDEPHIVHVRDLHMDDRDGALILDYIDGETLAARLAERRAANERMTVDEAVAVVTDLAAALSAAHAAGLVHRDVTPSNILIGRDGMAHLTDFGIAHSTADETTAVTAQGFVLGTMRYLAPEQLRGEPATAATDLHGLASVAYEMVAGRPVYDVTSPVALVEAQQFGAAKIDDVAPAVDAAIRAGLEPDPARRPATVGAFATGLAAAAGGVPGANDATVALALPIATGAGEGDREVVAGPPDEPSREPTGTGAGGAIVATATADRGARIPGPVAAAIALAIAVIVIAAASGLERGGPPGAAADPTRTAKPTVRPTPTPTVAPKPAKPADKGHGHGHGHGKGDGGDGGD